MIRGILVTKVDHLFASSVEIILQLQIFIITVRFYTQKKLDLNNYRLITNNKFCSKRKIFNWLYEPIEYTQISFEKIAILK